MSALVVIAVGTALAAAAPATPSSHPAARTGPAKTAATGGAFVGCVRTAEGRVAGPVGFLEGGVAVGGRRIPWTDLLWAVRRPEVETVPPTQAAILADGQVWRGEVVRLRNGRVTVRLAALDREVEVPAERLAALVLGADAGPGPPSAASAEGPGAAGPETLVPDRGGVLFRPDGEPLPGALLWIEPDRLAIDSPLGAVTLPRAGCALYRFGRSQDRTAPAPSAGRRLDRVGLAEGSVLAGRVEPADHGLRLTGADLGRVVVPERLVRWVERADPRFRRLGLPSSPSGPTAFRGGTLAAEPGPGAIAAWRIHPPQRLACPLDPSDGRPLRLAMRVRPAGGARGSVRLRLLVGGTVLLDRIVSPADAPVDLEVPLPAAPPLASAGEKQAGREAAGRHAEAAGREGGTAAREGGTTARKDEPATRKDEPAPRKGGSATRNGEPAGQQDEAAGRDGGTAGRDGGTAARKDEPATREGGSATRNGEPAGQQDEAAGGTGGTAGCDGEAAGRNGKAGGGEAGTAARCLVIEVGFGPDLGFPCGLCVEDPVLLMPPKARGPGGRSP